MAGAIDDQWTLKPKIICFMTWWAPLMVIEYENPKIHFDMVSDQNYQRSDMAGTVPDHKT